MKEQEPRPNSKFAPAVFPADIMYDENLDSTERWILTILFTYTNAHSNTAFPSYQTIADRSSFSRRTCIRTVDRLIEKGYIVKKEAYQRSQDGKISQTSNVYTLYFKERDGDKNSFIRDSSNVIQKVYSEVVTESHPPSAEVVTESHPPSDTASPKLSIELSIEEEEEEERTEKFPKQYIEMALKIGASKADLEVALKKMDSEPDIKNHVAWLRKALESEVINRDLARRPRTLKDTKSTLTAKKAKTEPSKYDNFYL